MKRVWTRAQMLQAYVEAKLSGRGADPEVVAKRLASCESCPLLRSSVKGRWCGACGCGPRQEAIIDPDPVTGHSKLQFVKLRCPLGRPGFSNEVTDA